MKRIMEMLAGRPPFPPAMPHPVETATDHDRYIEEDMLRRRAQVLSRIEAGALPRRRGG